MQEKTENTENSTTLTNVMKLLIYNNLSIILQGDKLSQSTVTQNCLLPGYLSSNWEFYLSKRQNISPLFVFFVKVQRSFRKQRQTNSFYVNVYEGNKVLEIELPPRVK